MYPEACSWVYGTNYHIWVLLKYTLRLLWGLLWPSYDCKYMQISPLTIYVNYRFWYMIWVRKYIMMPQYDVILLVCGLGSFGANMMVLCYCHDQGIKEQSCNHSLLSYCRLIPPFVTKTFLIFVAGHLYIYIYTYIHIYTHICMS